jgi:phosphate ABC transporter phosphate-binding protein
VKRTIGILTVAFFAGVAGGCGGASSPSGSEGRGVVQGGVNRLNGGGSSFVYPMMSKWASEYDKAKGVKVNYQSVGSGGGIQQMTAKTFDFGCTDAPMTEEQLTKAKSSGGDVVHIPLIMGAVVPIYHLEEVEEPLRFSGPVLADIFLEKVKKWNDPKLAELNPGVKLPNKDILTVHRSDGSGTTFIFADYLSKVSPEWKEKVGLGMSVKWVGGVGAKGSEGVSQKVAQSPGAVSYVELTYALQNKIKFGVVQNKEGEFVKPSLESVTAAAKNALTDIPEDLRYSLTDASGKDSYPLSGTVWAVIYVNQPAGKGQAVVDFLRWVTHDGQQYAKGLDYARLPDELVPRLDKKLDQVKVGK